MRPRRLLPLAGLLLLGVAWWQLDPLGTRAGGPRGPEADPKSNGDVRNGPTEIDGPARTTGEPTPAPVPAGMAATAPTEAVADGVLEGVVARPDGAPIEGALVVAETVAVAGKASFDEAGDATARSGPDGAFRLAVPRGRRLEVSAHHPRFIPAFLSLPRGTEESPVRLAMTPALVARFRIRSAAAGPPPAFVTVTWRTKGRDPRQQNVALGEPADVLAHDPHEALVEEPPSEPSLSRAVKVPVSGPTVDFTLSSLGFRPFSVVDEPLPPAGGERVYDALLERDPTMARLRLTLVDEAGRALPYAAPGALARVRRADGGPRPNQRPTDVEGQALFEGLPPAAYQVVVAYPGRAPGFASCDLEAGADVEVPIVLGPESRLTVKFPGVRLPGAQFRLLRDGEVVVAFSGADAPTTDAGPTDRSRPTYLAGPDGVSLGGLGAGHYEVEVVSQHLVAPRTPVDLGPAETREIVIATTVRAPR